MPQTNVLADLLTASAKCYRTHDSEIAHALAEALAGLVDHPIVMPSSPPPLEGVLNQIFARGGDPLAGPVADVATVLAWWTGGGAKKPVEISNSLSGVEIAGPTGMIRTDACRWGLFLQSAGHDYPEHCHAAEELYFVIGGTADWTRDGGPPVPRPPGSFIHHPSWMPHAMHTRTQPLLAMWGWTGDIDYSRYRFVA